MSNQPVPDGPPTPAPESWGEVRTRHQVVRYRRSGAGRAVLLLHSPDARAPLWPEVLEHLAAGGRLIVPNPPESADPVEEWLALLLEGLGLWNAILVATEGFCIPAIERALVEPDRIARIILACSDGPDAAAVEKARTALSSVPLLLLKRDQPAGEALSLVAAFTATA